MAMSYTLFTFISGFCRITLALLPLHNVRDLDHFAARPGNVWQPFKIPPSCLQRYLILSANNQQCLI